MADWLHLCDTLKANTKKYPHKIAFRDARRSLTFLELEERTNRLAHALYGLGLKQGDKVAVMFPNCVEFAEFHIAMAKAGMVVVPVNTRQVGKEIQYVVDNADAQAFFVHENYLATVESIRTQLPQIEPGRYVALMANSTDKPAAYIDFEEVVKSGKPTRPVIAVSGKDPWMILYTSGTTGVPKGVVRSHESYTAFYLTNAADYSFTPEDKALILMPFFHVNSTFYAYVFTYLGASVYIHRETQFNPEELLQIIDREKCTFSSMIPTHYNLILNLPAEVKKKYDLRSIKSLLCSSAPVREQTKLGIMELFTGVRLFEGYGSTEAGLVTLLRPEDQMRKLGSIGFECLGADEIRVLDDNGKEVATGQVGELHSRGPMLFTEYYKLPDKTRACLKDGYFTARDMVRRDQDGYYAIVDRKDNMVISGGEHVYPSEVEAVIATHPSVFDVAVIGVPDAVWGEAVMAVVILKDHEQVAAADIVEYCRPRLAGYKKPKAIEFIKPEEMPRTATGKILHRQLRERYRAKKPLTLST